ncbi:MAG: PIG-L deacetylase family protein [Motilibacteraceae bacterium]
MSGERSRPRRALAVLVSGALVVTVGILVAGGSTWLAGRGLGDRFHPVRRAAAALGPARRLLAGGPERRAAALSPLVAPGRGLTSRPDEGTRGWQWRPLGALPPSGPRTRPTLVVLSPHPDDETLSMGVLLAEAEQRGVRCVLVVMTDGWTTSAFSREAQRWDGWAAQHPVGAIGVLRHLDPAAVPPMAGHGAQAGIQHAPGLTRQVLALARTEETRAAAERLGVAAGDVVLAHLDAPDSDGGPRTTVAEAESVIRVMARRFPGATFVTMSYSAERQPDHLDDGVALERLAAAGVVRRALFTVSRLWWGLPSPTARWLVPGDLAVRSRVLAAAASYQEWEPADLRLGVGWASVRQQFEAMLHDVRDRLHGLGPGGPSLPWVAAGG